MLDVESDAKSPRIGAYFFDERPLAGWRPIGVAGRWSTGGVQERGAVANAPGNGMAGGKSAPAFAHIRPGGVAPTCRLQPEQAAVRGRNADRAAAVRGMGGGHHAGGDRRGSTPAGAAGT